MTVIGTNVAALRATNASNTASAALATSIERLSTGKRINSAKDDAAGLAIASSLTSQIKGQNQAIRNANDGIALSQTADGALGEVTNILQRVRELAVQSASGTYAAGDRTNLQAEVTQLTGQLSDIQSKTNFNGVSLLGTTAATVKIQTGSSATDTVSLAVGGLDLSGVTGSDISTAAGATTALGALDAGNAGCGPKPPKLGGQQPDDQRRQSDRRPQPHRRRRLLDRDDQPRQGADPQPGLDRTARSGEPVAAGRAEAARLRRTGPGTRPPIRVSGPTGISCVRAGRSNENPGDPAGSPGFLVSGCRTNATLALAVGNSTSSG
jgi:flagellin